MGNLARILVADDLEREKKSEPTPVLRLASDLAERLQSEIHLVHAYDIPQLAVPARNLALLEAPYVEEMTRALDEEGEQVRAGRPNLRLVSEVGKGATVDVLLGDAHVHDCGLVVLGTHGRGGMKRALLGSVAEEVIRRSKVPVLSVNPHAHFPTPYHPSRILLAVDPSELDSRLFNTARDFARAFGAALTVLHVVEEWVYPIVQSASLLAGGFVMPLERDLQELGNQRFAQLEEIKARFTAEGVRVETKLLDRARSVGEAIVTQAETLGCELIMMGHRHASRLEYALLGSVNRQVVRDAHCPVLTIGAL